MDEQVVGDAKRIFLTAGFREMFVCRVWLGEGGGICKWDEWMGQVGVKRGRVETMNECIYVL
jgi:hypothetical protein